MSDVQHTPEPWALFEANTPGLGETIVVGGSSDEVGTFQPGVCIITDKASANPRDWANARRIVACVNACRGLSTDTLETFGTTVPSGIVYHLEQANRERDEAVDQSKRLEYLCTVAEERRADALRERDEARAMVAELAVAVNALHVHLSNIVMLGGPYPELNGKQVIADTYKVLSDNDATLKKAEAIHA